MREITQRKALSGSIESLRRKDIKGAVNINLLITMGPGTV